MKAGIIIILNNGFICTLEHDNIYLMVRSQQYVFLELQHINVAVSHRITAGLGVSSPTLNNHGLKSGQNSWVTKCSGIYTGSAGSRGCGKKYMCRNYGLLRQCCLQANKSSKAKIQNNWKTEFFFFFFFFKRSIVLSFILQSFAHH